MRLFAIFESFPCHDLSTCTPWLLHIFTMIHSYVCHLSRQRVTKRAGFSLHMRSSAMTYSCVCHDSLIHVPSLIDMCAMTPGNGPRNAWYIYIHMLYFLRKRSCALTHPYVCHDSLMCVPWLIDMCAMTPGNVRRNVRFIYVYILFFTHVFVRHDSLICAPWLIDMCTMTHWYVCHDSREWATRRARIASTYVFVHDSLICAPWLIDMCAMTPGNGRRNARGLPL